jgi:hypothetical protein
MQELTVNDEQIRCFSLAQHLAFDEPIPDFSSRYPNILESCLAVPFSVSIVSPHTPASPKPPSCST